MHIERQKCIDKEIKTDFELVLTFIELVPLGLLVHSAKLLTVKFIQNLQFLSSKYRSIFN